MLIKDIEKLTQKQLCLESCNDERKHSMKFIEKFDDEQTMVKTELKMELIKLFFSYVESSGVLDKYYFIISAAFTFVLALMIGIVVTLVDILESIYPITSKLQQQDSEEKYDDSEEKESFEIDEKALHFDNIGQKGCKNRMVCLPRTGIQLLRWKENVIDDRSTVILDQKDDK